MKKDGKVLRRMLGYLSKYRGLLAGGFIGVLFSVPLALLGPIFIGRAVDAIIGEGDVDFASVLLNLSLLAGSVLLSAFLQWIMHMCARKVSARAAQEIRRQAFDRINEVPLSRIDSHSHGDIVSRLVNDADAVSEGFLQGIIQMFPGIITIVVTIVLMLTLNTTITIVVILITPLSILFARLVTRRTSKLFVQQSEAQGEMSGYVGEMVASQNLLMAFSYEETSELEFEAVNQKYFTSSFKATMYASIINPGTRFVNSIVYAAVGILGAILAVNGSITVGGVSAFLAYANQYTRPFNEITAVIAQLQSAVVGARRLFEVIDWESEAADVDEALAPEYAKGAVAAEDVYFSYVPERPLIQNFSVNVQPGQRIALVGPTGCGKTTIINLLMRFYEVNKGVIAVDGTPVSEIKRDNLRRLYGMVLQETWLKCASVRDNIAYARPHADDEEIIAAAKAAYAHRFIMRLPNGYETIIESGGGNLSAGQKQLLCIARIILTKPDMLILDEATSSIDTRTEMLIQKAMQRLMEGHTSFIVAHRLSTIQNADLILMMDAGRVVEQGKHEELLAKEGHYASLYNSQFVLE